MKWLAGSMMAVALIYLVFLLIFATHKMLQNW